MASEDDNGGLIRCILCVESIKDPRKIIERKTFYQCKSSNHCFHDGCMTRSCRKHDQRFQHQCGICFEGSISYARINEMPIRTNYRIINERFIDSMKDETRILFCHSREHKKCMSMLRLSTTHHSGEHYKIMLICTLIAALRRRMVLPAELACEISKYAHTFYFNGQIASGLEEVD